MPLKAYPSQSPRSPIICSCGTSLATRAEELPALCPSLPSRPDGSSPLLSRGGGAGNQHPGFQVRRREKGHPPCTSPTGPWYPLPCAHPREARIIFLSLI